MTVLSIVRPSSKPVTGDLTAIAGLLANWRAEARQLKQLDPTSAALPARESAILSLDAALTEAKRRPAWLSIADAHEKLSVPVSTIRWYCKTRAVEIGAEKLGGMWRINARALESFLAQKATLVRAA